MSSTEEIAETSLLAAGWIRSPDRREWISVGEHRLRMVLEFAFRFSLGTFCSAHLFDLLFSPIWMHGYLWALNQYSEVDMTDKSALDIIDHQLAQCGNFERLIHAALSTAAVALILRVSGFHHSNRTVWDLLRLSLACGAVSGLTRTVQMQQRLYSAVHESFFIYLNFFVVGLCLTLRVFERHEKKLIDTGTDAIQGNGKKEKCE